MVSLNPPQCDFGCSAPDFVLPGTNGHTHSPATARGSNGLRVMFVCIHYPCVKAILDRLLRAPFARAGRGPTQRKARIGCAIKWREAA